MKKQFSETHCDEVQFNDRLQIQVQVRHKLLSQAHFVVYPEG